MPDIDYGQILEALNDKTDTDLGNLSTLGKIAGCDLSMPSGTYDNLTLGATGTSYTAPANGWFVSFFKCTSAMIGTWVSVDTKMSNSGSTAGSYDYVGASIQVKKGETVQYFYNHPAPYYFRFVYAEGSKSEQ